MEKAVEAIIETIVKHDQPQRVYVFGSTGRGDAQEGSDVDIAVLYEHLDRNPFEAAASLRMSLLDVTTLPIDLLFYEVSDFERRASHASSMERTIAREGILAYG